jgi:predicted lipoprotein with Yx(FWY)xxD motif
MIRQTSLWLLGLGIMSPLLLGMVSCGTDTSGITLPQAGRSAADTGGTGGSSDASGATGGDVIAQAGSVEVGAGGQDENGPASGGTTGGTHATGGTGAKGGKGGSGGSSTSHTGGTNSGGGTDAMGSGGSADSGGTDSVSPEAGAGGEASATGGTGNVPGEAGAGGSPDEVPAKLCLFHSAPALVSGGGGSGGGGGSAGGGGSGGAGAPPVATNDVLVGNNAFVGPYLTDSAGIALYIYGADVPGDCNTPPVSNCTADCLQSWPLFDAGARHLDPTLDDGVFGTLDRGGGVYQTTFYGWPLYRYKSDTAANVINGQGKGKTWFAAEVELPNLMIMRGPVSGGGIKYLSDDKGHTLYSLSGDTLGGSGVQPKSACTGDCLAAFLPYAPGSVYPVTSIEPHDVGLFFRADGSLQTTYKGAPLYYAKSDVSPGQTNGLAGLFGGALVVP